jgi:hypothetical protein
VSAGRDILRIVACFGGQAEEGGVIHAQHGVYDTPTQCIHSSFDVLEVDEFERLDARRTGPVIRVRLEAGPVGHIFLQLERSGPVEISPNVLRPGFQDDGMVVCQVVKKVGVSAVELKNNAVSFACLDTGNVGEQVGGWSFAAQAVKGLDDVIEC